MANDMTDAIKAKMEADPAFATALGAARTREAAGRCFKRRAFTLRLIKSRHVN